MSTRAQASEQSQVDRASIYLPEGWRPHAPSFVGRFVDVSAQAPILTGIAVQPVSRTRSLLGSLFVVGLLVGGAGVAIFVVVRAANVFGLFDDGGEIPALNDDSFTEEAALRCADARTRFPLAADLAAADPATRAEALTARAAALDSLTLELRALPADPRSVGTLDWWFENLDTVVATDQRTAEALTSGDATGAEAIADDGDIAADNARSFARDNKLSACAF